MAEGGGGVHVVLKRLHEGLVLLFEFLRQLRRSRARLPFFPGEGLVGFAQAFVDALLAALALVHGVEREVDGAAVVLPGEEVAQGFRQVGFQNVADGLEVAERLGHLFRIHLHEAVVHPDVGERLAERGLGLGDFVLVMGEDEVEAAAVDIQRKRDVLFAHGRAFDVPAGASPSPRAFPVGLTGLGAFPQGEVQRVFLFVAGRHARAGAQFVGRAAGELAVAGEGANPEIDVAGGRGVGLAVLDEAFGQVEHFLNVLGGFRLDVRAHDPEAVHVLMVGRDVGFRDLRAADALVVGALDDLVVHVREVADEGDFVTLVAQEAHHDVEGHGGTGVSDVGEGVGRDAAGVEADLPLADGREGFLFPGHGIVELHEDSFKAGSRGKAVQQALPAAFGRLRHNRRKDGARLGREAEQSGFDLVDAAQVAAAFKVGVEEDGRDVEGDARPRDALAQTEDVGVVVHTRGPRLKFAAAEGGPDAGDVVGGHAHADAGSTYEDAEGGRHVAGRGVPGFGQHLFAHLFGVDRVVAAFRSGGAEVMDLMPFPGELFDERGLEPESRMIGADIDDSHRFCPREVNVRDGPCRSAGLPSFHKPV